MAIFFTDVRLPGGGFAMGDFLVVRVSGKSGAISEAVAKAEDEV